MGVGLNAAGRNDLTSGVDASNCLFSEGVRGSYSDDLLPLHCYVPVADASRGYHLAATNDQIQHPWTSFDLAVDNKDQILEQRRQL